MNVTTHTLQKPNFSSVVPLPWKRFTRSILFSVEPLAPKSDVKLNKHIQFLPYSIITICWTIGDDIPFSGEISNFTAFISLSASQCLFLLSNPFTYAACPWGFWGVFTLHLISSAVMFDWNRKWHKRSFYKFWHATSTYMKVCENYAFTHMVVVQAKGHSQGRFPHTCEKSG